MKLGFNEQNISQNQKMLGQIPLADLYILLTDKESTGRANCIHILSREGSKMRSVYAAATMPRVGTSAQPPNTASQVPERDLLSIYCQFYFKGR